VAIYIESILTFLRNQNFKAGISPKTEKYFCGLCTRSTLAKLSLTVYKNPIRKTEYGGSCRTKNEKSEEEVR
jgi:hypothetical protein